jgi:hypothetical protein
MLEVAVQVVLITLILLGLLGCIVLIWAASLPA